MDWLVQAKVSRAIKADGRGTVARKCMLTQCIYYAYIVCKIQKRVIKQRMRTERKIKMD